MKLPCILHEDEDILVVNKPAGISTHQSDTYSPWGLVELLTFHTQTSLSIHQRLDKETSGVIVFAKSDLANKSLSKQFEERSLSKKYLFATTNHLQKTAFTVQDSIEGKSATTHFQYLKPLPNGFFLWEATLETGRTHQIRIHARTHGIPIVGDDESPSLREPLLLHSSSLSLKHPRTNQLIQFQADVPSYFRALNFRHRLLIRAKLLRDSFLSNQTNGYRSVHRHSDGFSNLSIDRLSDFLYIEDFSSKTDPKHLEELLDICRSEFNAKGVVYGSVTQGSAREEKKLVQGEAPPEDFIILENNLKFRINPLSPGGIGLFFDQRENRQRLQSLSKGKRVLNLFAYTCGFSVAAAVGGAKETVSVDLSKKYLEWGKQNLAENQIKLENHSFLAWDTFDALKKLRKKTDRFDMIIVDPPSFSRSKFSGSFSVKKDMPELIKLSSGLISSNGWLFASSNLADWKWEDFIKTIETAVRSGGRRITEKVMIPQPFDFPVSKTCPAHLKSIWLKLN
jgi:23S rRNA (cytosine1962-C5)-methyltransferase